ncbi:MAG: DUF488 family protein [Micropruina sp.]
MTQPATEFVLKRIYQPAADQDGYRVLLDRLWPRGVSKERARLDEAKELAPSTELRRWFGHVPERFEEFTRRYTAELRANPGLDERWPTGDAPAGDPARRRQGRAAQRGRRPARPACRLTGDRPHPHGGGVPSGGTG